MRGLLILLCLACGSSELSSETADDQERRSEPVVVATAPAEEEASDEACSPAAIVAARRALQSAQEAGVPVDGCDVEQAACMMTPRDLQNDACRVVVTSASERWQVRIQPRPANGAPDHYEAWISEDGTEVGRTWIGASTWAVTSTLRVLGQKGHARHTHGGDAARIGHATFQVDNTSMTPVRLMATKVTWLTSPSCDPDFTARAELIPPGLALDDGDTETAVVLVPGEHQITVGFEPQSAYYSYCDRFAAKVSFIADGEAFEAIAETEVMRVEPYRP